LFDGAKLSKWRASLEDCDAVLPVIPIADTVVETNEGRVTNLLDRSKLGAVQTPQLFRLSVLRRAHQEALARGETDASDDGGLLLAIDADVRTVIGDAGNFKITRPEDLKRAERELKECDD
jgi:2-C-methyl-D-erythritol 4-phosphate cytidylyltransferase